MNDEPRPDPDALLAQVQREEHQEKRGRLYIILGMCPGVGKTYAMLLLAKQRQLDGLAVLVGIVETHGREDTAALLADLTVLPRMQIEHGGHTLEEFDLDGAIQRRPDLLLVDELAHTNAPGSRHLKRYQDVLELLDSGVDVCTTLNVQHIESQVDIVRQVTGVAVRETVPDSILDRAHEIQLVDLSVEKLLLRLAEGKVYLGERAEAAAGGFFRAGNLTALRELALRFTAERVDRDLEDIRKARRVGSPWKTNARLLVGVGPTPYSESLIRWTRRASGRHACPWLAVWVEGTSPLTSQEQEFLARGLGLARRLGGEVVHATGDDVAATLLDVARERNVSQIIVGKTDHRALWRPSLADRIIAGSGEIDVSVVRPVAGRSPGQASAQPRSFALASPHRLREYGFVIALLGVLTALCWQVAWVAGYTMPALVYLFAILLAAFRFSRGPMLMMAGLSALAWDFFFIPPRFTLQIKALEDVILLGMFFAVALCMGSLTTRLRTREAAERRRQQETDALLRVTQSAALIPETEKGLSEALQIINGVIDADTALVVRLLDHSLPTAAHPASTWQPPEREFGVAAWSYANKKVAGRFTDTLPQSAATWFPLQTATSVMGVLGLRLSGDGDTLDFLRHQAVEAFALQLALVLEKEHFMHAVNQTELMDKSDRLRRTLLDSVSHELKTPLAIIHAAIEGMGAAAANPYVEEISTASKRLQRLVDGLLQMTRLESEVVEPQLEWCDVSELVGDAVAAVSDALKTHSVQISISPDLPLIKTDHALLQQALTNVLHNAAVYSPAQSAIELSARHADHRLRLSVRDHGPGLPPGEEARVFGKFYRAPGAPAGGTGLGLSIARGFVQAIGGDITGWNHPEGGAVFEILLPAEFMAQGAES